MQSGHQQHQNSQNIPCTNNNPNILGGSSPLVMPVFPLRTSQSGHGSNYSPYSPTRYNLIYLLFILILFYFAVAFIIYLSI